MADTKANPAKIRKATKIAVKSDTDFLDVVQSPYKM